MNIDLFHHGQYIMTVKIDSGIDDIAVVSKKIISVANVSPEGFDELFFTALKYSKNHVEAYENAEKIHRDNFGHNKYSSYEAFSVSKSKRLNK